MTRSTFSTLGLMAMAALLLGATSTPSVSPATDPNAELDAYWRSLARTVAEGDYEGYKAGYHPDAVLVSVDSGNSYPISQAFDGWKQGFDDTRAGKMKAGVDFRFTQRLNDATTAHETGMFRYWAQPAGQEPQVMLLHFQALLVKRAGRWLTVMEYQMTPATQAEWDAAG